MKIRAVVFDWDGVIVNTMPELAKGIREVASSYGIQLSVETILATYFQPRQDFYKSIGIDPEDVEGLHRRHNEAINRHSGLGEMFDDVKPALEELKHMGVSLGVATQNDVSNIEREINRLDLGNFFHPEYVLGGKYDKAEKLKILTNKFGVLSKEFLFVGDLPSDIVAAKDAGVMSAGINRQAEARERLVNEKPDILLSSLSELIHSLK